MTLELAIETKGLTKQFDRYIAVNGVDLEVNAGEVYGLIGPNGAGKTTLIKMLVAAEEPTTGEIYIHGDRLRLDQNNARLKRRLGYLPDDFPLYDDLTVWDYLDYFARLYRLKDPKRSQRLREVLELIQLTNKRNSLISTLSRGMKQRLSLARTIIHEPIVLFLDEPVSGLDPIARMQFRDIIKTLQTVGMTIVISSHVLSDLAELCSSVGIMELGYLVESASLSELYERMSLKKLVVSSLGSCDDLVAELKNYSLIGEVELVGDKNQVKADFNGDLAASAQLLKGLVDSGMAITEFHMEQEDLESIFLKLGHKQAS